jgi:hypothetical protein
MRDLKVDVINPSWVPGAEYLVIFSGAGPWHSCQASSIPLTITTISILIKDHVDLDPRPRYQVHGRRLINIS